MSTAQEFAAAVLIFGTTAVLYYRGHLHVAFVLGYAFWFLIARVLLATLGPWLGLAVFLPLGVVPAWMLAAHAYDVRTGVFNLPMVYAIPISFVFGVPLMAAAGLGVLFG